MGAAARPRLGDVRYVHMVCGKCKQEINAKVTRTLQGEWASCPICGRVWRV
jgi:hypothetical protein